MLSKEQQALYKSLMTCGVERPKAILLAVDRRPIFQPNVAARLHISWGDTAIFGPFEVTRNRQGFNVRCEYIVMGHYFQYEQLCYALCQEGFSWCELYVRLHSGIRLTDAAIMDEVIDEHRRRIASRANQDLHRDKV